MMTLTASPKTTRKPAPVALTCPAPQKPARPSFWMALMHALAAPAF